MTALALQWEGKEREISVVIVDTIDASNHLYRAAVRFGGLDQLVDKNFQADVETVETIAVSVATDGVVSVTQDLRRRIYENRGRLPCGTGARIDLGVEQIFSGRLDNGSIVAFRQTDAKPIGADMWQCGRALTYEPDRVSVLKLIDGKLLMYRTNGVEFPETAEFQR